jgi:tyrosinase
MVNACNSRGDYADMADCSERGAHAWGHNGIGAVMQDTAASPSDPVFWLHHGFVDRNFRIWQNQNSARLTYVNGVDKAGNPLTLDTGVSVNGLRPNIQIRDLLDTTNTRLCYKYNY